MNPPAPFWRRRENWIGVLLTVAFHASIAALIEATWPPPLGARPAPSVPHFALLSDPAEGPGGETWDSDPRALWSPVLFALPTAAGFSPSRPAVFSPYAGWRGDRAASGLWLDRMPIAPPPAQPLHARTASEASAILAQRWLQIPAIDDPFGLLAPTSAVLQVDWPDGAPEFSVGLPTNLEPAPGADERPWEAAATINFSDAGDVRSVFLEQSTATRERNESLVRMLRRLRVPPGRATTARVNLYLQRPPLAAARASEPAP